MSETRQQTITERETPHGYWWRYRHTDNEPQDTLLAAIMRRRGRRQRSAQARQDLLCRARRVGP